MLIEDVCPEFGMLVKSRRAMWALDRQTINIGERISGVILSGPS